MARRKGIQTPRKSTVRVGRKRHSIRLLLGLGVLVLVGVIVAVSTLQGRERGSSGIALAAPAPDFTLTTLDGGKYTLSQNRGKVRVVFFMIQPY